MGTGYQEFKPQEVLQPFVECYWLHTFETIGDGESPVQRCLPFGTLELILHLDDNRCHVFADETWQTLPQAFFVGIYRDAVQWKSVGSGRKFGIRLKPESLPHLFHVPVASLFNNFTDTETFFGKSINRLSDDVYGLPDITQVIGVVETFLIAQLRNSDSRTSRLSEATNMIRQSRGRMSIETLSEKLYVSKRQLERLFKENYGTSPKTFQRIIRFRNAYEAFHGESAMPNWADISFKFGYSDQAHFIRDFKEFANEVPTSVFQDRRQYFRVPDKQTFVLA
jgi:AraC-like DNA-binding protein